MSEISGIAPETDPKTIENFAVHNPITIEQVLQNVMDDEHEVYLHTNDSNAAMVTEILGFDWENRRMWLAKPLDHKVDELINRRTRYTIVAFPSSVKIQFSGEGITLDRFQTIQALCIEVPDELIRLQRRSYFRILADEELNHQVSLDIPGVDYQPEVLDISLAGLGWLAREPGDHYQTGQQFDNVRLTLADGQGAMLIGLVIRNISPSETDETETQLGCELLMPEVNHQKRLQRFLLATERRQRARRNFLE